MMATNFRIGILDLQEGAPGLTRSGQGRFPANNQIPVRDQGDGVMMHLQKEDP
jgi:hypothetical protein